MFNIRNSEEKPRPIEIALDDLVKRLNDHDPDSKEYTAIVNNIKTLSEANAVDHSTYKKLSVSPETLATIGANLAGILLILNHERAHVLTSKAMQHIIRPKI